MASFSFIFILDDSGLFALIDLVTYGDGGYGVMVTKTVLVLVLAMMGD